MADQKHAELSLLEIMAPAWSDKEPAATKGLFEALHSLQLSRRSRSDPRAFGAEIVANRQGIRFLWSGPNSQEYALRHLLQSYCPDFKIFKTEDYKWPKGNHLRLLNFKFSHDFKQSLKTPESLEDHDPLGYLTAALVKLQEDEQICYQILCSPLGKQKGGSQNFIDDRLSMKILKGAAGLTGKAAAGCLGLFQMNTAEIQNQTTQTLTEPEKVQTPLFKSSLRILISTPSKTRLEQHAQSLTAALSLFNNFISQNLIAERQNKEQQFIAFRRREFAARRKLICLGPAELAGLYHFPNTKSSSSEALPRFLSRTLPPTSEMLARSEHHVLLGENHHQEQITPIGLSKEERKRHVYIVGGTGTGKTTLLKYQIVQDIKAGRGVAVIDPHGDLATDILGHIPKKRINDVVYFNPSDYEHPMGINLLQLPEGLEGKQLEHAKDMRTEAMVSVLRKVFHGRDEEIGHRIEYVLRNTIQTSFAIMQPGLFTIFKLLNDKKYNSQAVKALKDPYLKMFWRNEIGKAGAMQKVKMQAGVTSKIGRFIFSPSVKNVFNQDREDCLDFDEIINKKKILICNFSKGLLGEDASQLFSATVLAQIQLTVLEQVSKKEAKRTPLYLYVDEFQNFATRSFIEMLSEARKYGLNLIMAQQSTQQQADRKLVETILANVGTTIAFRTASPSDSKLLTPLLDPFVGTSDLINLSTYQFYAKINALKPMPPVSVTTQLLPDSRDTKNVRAIIRTSRRNFASISN